MDEALSVKNIGYGKVNLHITKSGSDVNQPKISTKVYPYMGKRPTTPSQPSEAILYRGVLPAYKPLKEKVVSETSVHYLPTYGKSSCALTYNDLQHLSIQVSLRNNFKVKLDEIYFSYVFVNGQPYQTYTDGFEAYMTQP